MQEFKSLGVENLAKALKKLSTQLEVDEKLENIRRTTEVRELDVDDRVARSIYAVSDRFPLLGSFGLQDLTLV